MGWPFSFSSHIYSITSWALLFLLAAFLGLFDSNYSFPGEAFMEWCLVIFCTFTAFWFDSFLFGHNKLCLVTLTFSSKFDLLLGIPSLILFFLWAEDCWFLFVQERTCSLVSMLLILREAWSYLSWMTDMFGKAPACLDEPEPLLVEILEFLLEKNGY